MYPRYCINNCALILLFLLIFLQNPVFAADNDDYQRYQKKLERVQQSINKVKEHLKSTRYKRGHVVTDLQKLESKISKNAAELGKTEEKIEKLDSRIVGLRGELAVLQEKLKKQRQRLSEQIRAAYAIGKQQQVKMLLNQQDPAEMGRVMVYFDYLNQAREQLVSFKSLTKKGFFLFFLFVQAVLVFFHGGIQFHFDALFFGNTVQKLADMPLTSTVEVIEIHHNPPHFCRILLI